MVALVPMRSPRCSSRGLCFGRQTASEASPFITLNVTTKGDVNVETLQDN